MCLPNLCFFANTKFNARNIIFNQRPILINKISSNPGKNCKNYYHQYNIHCTRTTFITIFIFSKTFLANFTSSIVLGHSSTNLSTNFFLHLQFLQSKYSSISHALSHSHSQLLGFQINPLSHTPLSINSLHSHLYLILFQRCLLLQTFSPNLHSH